MCTAFPTASMWAMVALALIAAGAPICALRAKSGGICETVTVGSAASAMLLPRRKCILMGFPRRGERDKIRSAVPRARGTLKSGVDRLNGQRHWPIDHEQTEYRGDQHVAKLVAFATVAQW